MLYAWLVVPVLLLTCSGAAIGQHLWWSPGEISSLPIGDSSVSLKDIERIQLDFSHTLSLYSWGGGANISLPSASKAPKGLSFLLFVDGRSRLREDTRTRTNEGNAALHSSYPLIDSALTAEVALFGSTYSLNQPNSPFTAALQRLSDGYALGGIGATPSAGISVHIGGGIAYKSFQYGSSSGSIFQVQGVLSPLAVSDASYLNASAGIDERHFNAYDEASRNDSAGIHLYTSFGEGGINDVVVNGSIQRRDFYFTVDSTSAPVRQERSEFNYGIRDFLRYPVSGDKLTFYAEAALAPKAVVRKTNGIDLATATPVFLTSSTFLLPSTTAASAITLSSRLEWIPFANNSSISAELKYGENIETNDITSNELPLVSSSVLQRISSILQATSFDARQTALSLNGLFPISTTDAITTTLASRIYRYDTQSEDNHDDRDELYLNAGIQYWHAFSSVFSGSIELRGAENHLVYLESDRSAQNYIGKTLTLSFKTDYISAAVRHSLSLELSANYSVYDFSVPIVEALGGRDYLIRGLNGTDSMLISCGKLFGDPARLAAIEAMVSVRFYERGSYQPEAFSERPLLQTSEASGDLTMNITDEHNSSPMLLKLGLRGFYQFRFAPVSSTVTSLLLQEQTKRLGPLAILILDKTSISGLRLFGSLWYSFIDHRSFDNSSQTRSTLAEGRLSVEWNF